ncbi:hypothetical protein MmazTMA_17160 [Methanosarcina mazei]|nr:hypothetical protein MmazTMA_17160 [Methanosarcina mazei]
MLAGASAFTADIERILVTATERPMKFLIYVHGYFLESQYKNLNSVTLGILDIFFLSHIYIYASK